MINSEISPTENPKEEPIEREKTDFELAIERSMGETIEEIQKTSLGDRWKRIEERTGKPMRVVHMSDYETYLTKDQLEKEVDKALEPEGCLPKILYRFFK